MGEDEEMKLNLPTPEGAKLGAELARLTDASAEIMEKAGEKVPDRCAGCALRLGTIANGCPPTLLTLTGCIVSGERFDCHERPGPCAGWLIATRQR